MSWDSLNPAQYDVNYPLLPTQVLNNLRPSGLPFHLLKLKVGAPVNLLRNLYQEEGLANGTRLIVRGLLRNVIDAEIALGPRAGQRAFLPRLNMATLDPFRPFALRRRQFPIRLAFAMSINKAQEQTPAGVGIYLPLPCFGYGQVHVNFTRSSSRATVKICVPAEAMNEAQGPDRPMYTSNLV